MPRLNEIYGGNYLKAEDIAGKEINVVIEDVTITEMDDKKKAVLHFKGKDKTLLCNVTNANMLEELLGSDDTDDWVGKRICLYTCKVDFQGKRVLAIRIKEATSGGKTAPAPAPKPPVTEEELDDAIPF
jgi:hypothetical protein